MEKALIEGFPPREVVRSAAKKFGVSERQAWKDLQIIRERWTIAGEEIRQRNEAMASLAMAVRRRDHIYRVCLASGERRTALEAEVDRCRLIGIYPVAETRAKVEVKSEVEMTAHHEHGGIEGKVREFAEIYDRLVAEQAALSGAAGNDGPRQ